MNLYVIRHGLAVDPGTPGYEDDSQRPLTDRGRKKMEAIASGLLAINVEFDRILASPYRRARETAEILAEAYKMKDRLTISPNLQPVGDIDVLIGEINEKYPVDSLAVVGHEPFLSELISTLLAGNTGVMINMKKGGVCCLAIDSLFNERRAVLEWLLAPSQLVKLGGQ